MSCSFSLPCLSTSFLLLSPLTLSANRRPAELSSFFFCARAVSVFFSKLAERLTVKLVQLVRRRTIRAGECPCLGSAVAAVAVVAAASSKSRH